MKFYDERLAKLKLETGQTSIIGVRPIESEEAASIIFAEKFESGLNAEDPSEFVFMEGHSALESKPQLHWVNSTVKGANKLGEEVAKAVAKAIETGEYQELDVLNPALDDERFRLEIRETLVPDDYQRDNLESRAKQNGDGSYLYKSAVVETPSGKTVNKQFAIFRNMRLFHPAISKTDKPENVLIRHDGMVEDYMELDVYQEATVDSNADLAAKAQANNKEFVDPEPASQEQEADKQPA